MRARVTSKLLTSAISQPTSRPFEIRDIALTGFLLRIQPSGARTYYVQISRSQRVRVGTAGVLTPDEARERATKILGNHAHGRPALEGIAGADGETLGSFIEHTYTPWLDVNRPKGADDTLRRLKNNFGKWFDRPISSVSVADVESWKLTRLGGGVKTGTVIRDLMSLSGVMSRAVKMKKLAENPVRSVDKPRIDRSPKVRFLDDSEETRLRSGLAARDAQLIAERESANLWRDRRNIERLPSLPFFGDHLTPAVLLSMNTGLRLGELTSLEWTDIDFKTALLTVRGDTAKSGQTRFLPINTEARDVLLKWREQHHEQRLFPIKSFKSSWSNLLTSVGISKFRWHDLRHHFASTLAQRAVPLNVIRDLLGHGSMTMVLRYAHLSPDTRRAAVELLTRPPTNETEASR